MSNSSKNPPAPRPGGLSLYANLLDPGSAAPGTISKGPVVFKPAETPDEASAKKPQIDSCMFLLPRDTFCCNYSHLSSRQLLCDFNLPNDRSCRKSQKRKALSQRLLCRILRISEMDLLNLLQQQVRQDQQRKLPWLIGQRSGMTKM